MKSSSSSGKQSARNRRATAARPRRAKLRTRRLQLEPRHLLAVVHWDGGGGDLQWSNPQNWSNDQLPTADDDVVIAATGTIVHGVGTTQIRSLDLQTSLNLTAGTITVDGTFTISSGRSLTASGIDVTFVASGQTTIDGTSIYVNAGANIEFTSVTEVTNIGGSMTWRVSGEGTELSFPNLVRISNGTDRYQDVFLEALDGGRLDLSAVTELLEPNSGDQRGRSIRVKAQGAGSVVDLAALERFTNHTVGSLGHDGGNPEYCRLEALEGGTIELGSLTEVRGVYIPLNPTSSVSVGFLHLLLTSLLVGNGRLNGSVINSGTVNPGNSPAGLTIAGSYTQTQQGTLRIDIEGDGSTVSFSHLRIEEQATLDGTGQIVRVGSPLPSIGKELVVVQANQIHSEFSAFNGLALGSGVKLQPVYGSDDVRLVGIVDAGPRIVGATPGGMIASSLRLFQVTFDEPINVASFTAEDIVLVGPQGVVTVNNPTLVSGNTFQFTVDTQVAPGVYSLTIGPNVTDVAGNPMDQNANGINGEAEDVFTHQVTVSDVQQAVLFVNVPGSYNADAGNFYQNLLSAGARAKRVDLASEGVVAAALAADDFDQVWVFDLATGSNDFPADWTAIADWYADDAAMEIICDARILGSLRSGRWQHEGLRLTENYYQNLRAAGGGLFLGTDDAAFQSGINSINAAIGIDPFSGLVSWSTIPGGVDATPPFVLKFMPLGPRCLDVDQLWVRFSEAIDPASFEPSDVSVTGPGGALDPAAFQVQMTAPNEFTIGIPAQSDEGVYQVVLGPDIRDLAGNPLAAAYLASFTIEVAWTTGNAAATGAWTDRLYLSVTPTWSANAISLGAQTFDGPLEPGASYGGSISVTLPLSNALPEGTYYLLVRTDDGHQVDEADETNNVHWRAIELSLPNLPDLAVSQIQAPAHANAGQSIPVSWTVTNLPGHATVSGERETAAR